MSHTLQPRHDHPQHFPPTALHNPNAYSDSIAAPYSQPPASQNIPPVGQLLPNIDTLSAAASSSSLHNQAYHNGMASMNGINGMTLNTMPLQPQSAIHMNNGMGNGMPPLMHHPQQYSNNMQPQQQPSQRALDPLSLEKDGKKFSLVVHQQPVRARMCGFGDKDRRPITPPPCIQLLVTDAITGKDIDPNDVDASYFVLTVDLWDQHGVQEVNLVRHSNSSPAVSISAATTTPYPPPPERPYLGLLSTAQLHAHYTAQGDHASAASMTHFIPQHRAALIQPYANQNQGYSTYPQSPVGVHGQMGYAPNASMSVPLVPTASTSGMFTRNLIGSLSVNAFKLTDPQGKTGFWFVLQDLSVRTEGSFRLKMNFVDVMDAERAGTLNTGKAQVLATNYSEAFIVYSAKKFPGVIESTPLSKCFAQQGIKIPIRKDVKVSNQSEYDADDQQ